MKFRMFALVSLVFISLTASNQTVMDVARSNTITWYGIDFSKAKFIGFERFITPDLLKDVLIKQWADATAKTNFSSKYHIKEVKIDINSAQKHNDAIEKKNLLTSTFYELSTESIQRLVSGYETSGEGYGFVFIVESFEKSTEKVYVYVCYFNEKDKNIVSMRRYIGKASGIGVENHYEGAIDDIIQYSSKDFKRFAKH